MSSDESTSLLESLQDEEEEIRKDALLELDIVTLKTLLNVMKNVLDNPAFKDSILPEHKKVLKPYLQTIAKLVDKKVTLSEKIKILQKSGHVYLPTSLEIIDDQLDNCKPKPVKRKRRDCPICDAEDLKRLPQHLSNVHGLSGHEKAKWLKKTKEEDE